MKYVFVIRMKPGHVAEEYAAAWLEVSRLIQQNHGACGTWLHRDLNDPARLLAIAQWTSKTARDRRPQQSEVQRLLHGLHEICEVQVIGEFAEPQWHVQS